MSFLFGKIYSSKHSTWQYVPWLKTGFLLMNGFEQNVNTKDLHVRYWQGGRKYVIPMNVCSTSTQQYKLKQKWRKNSLIDQAYE